MLKSTQNLSFELLINIWPDILHFIVNIITKTQNAYHAMTFTSRTCKRFEPAWCRACR